MDIFAIAADPEVLDLRVGLDTTRPNRDGCPSGWALPVDPIGEGAVRPTREMLTCTPSNIVSDKFVPA